MISMFTQILCVVVFAAEVAEHERLSADEILALRIMETQERLNVEWKIKIEKIQKNNSTESRRDFRALFPTLEGDIAGGLPLYTPRSTHNLYRDANSILHAELAKYKAYVYEQNHIINNQQTTIIYLQERLRKFEEEAPDPELACWGRPIPDRSSPIANYDSN